MKPSSERTELLVSNSGNIAPHIAYCEANAIDWRAIANECGLPSELMEKEHWLPTKDLMLFIYKLEMMHGYLIGLEIGEKASIAILSSQLKSKVDQCLSFEDGIHCLISEMASLSNHVTVWTEQHEGEWWLCHRSCYRPFTPGFEQAEWFRTLALINFCRHFLGESWAPDDVGFVSTATDAHQRSTPLSRAHIQYRQPFGRMVIPLNDDFQTIPLQKADVNWHRAVIALIRTYSVLPWFNIDWFSNMLGMTKRTLQRNLKKEGITFKGLKEECRKTLATQLLTSTCLSVQDIAWQTGYNDLSNFNRAFKGWTGISAPSYRQKYKSND